MRLPILFPIAAATFMAASAVASAAVSHSVAPGESLYSVAAADGLSVDQLAAANGLSPSGHLRAGGTLMIPPQTSAAAAGVSGAAGGTSSSSINEDGDVPATQAQGAAPVGASSAGGGSYVVQPGDTLSAIAARAGMTVSQLAAVNGLSPSGLLRSGRALELSGGTSAGSGAGQSRASTRGSSSAAGGDPYVVQPGDTLSAIAARTGTTVSRLAAANGVNANGVLLSGTPLSLSAATSSASRATSSAASQPVGLAAEGSSGSPPYPTAETVSPREVGQIAASEAVPSSLAQAIAYQESGFNNAAVSPADARGVMQILPGTWNWIGQTLSGQMPLAPASALSNVRAGVLLLHSLLSSTGGNPALAAAGYYQGLPSVLRNGLYPSTQQYVNDVMALRQRFGTG